MGGTVKRGVSATWLKYFACFFMLIDHFTAVLDPMAAIAAPDTLLYLLPRFLGRLAFPVFAYLLAEGCHKTSDLSTYIQRLFLFAIVAQVPFSLAFNTLSGNVIVTFFLAAAGISFYRSARVYVPPVVAFLPVLLMAALAALCDSDYGWMGVLIIFSVYLARTRGRKLLALALWLVILYFVVPVLQVYESYLPYLLNGVPPSVLWADLVSGLHFWFPFWLPSFLVRTASALLTLIPLYFYNGQRGKGGKYFFYFFYPAHLLILSLLARCSV